MALALPDVNVLVYAALPSSPHHGHALEIVRTHPLAWHDTLGVSFIRLATNPRILETPMTLREAQDFLAFARHGSVRLHYSPDYWPVFAALLEKYKVVGPAVSDCSWAALAIANGVQLISADRGFLKFSELDFRLLIA